MIESGGSSVIPTTYRNRSGREPSSCCPGLHRACPGQMHCSRESLVREWPRGPHDVCSSACVRAPDGPGGEFSAPTGHSRAPSGPPRSRTSPGADEHPISVGLARGSRAYDRPVILRCTSKPVHVICSARLPMTGPDDKDRYGKLLIGSALVPPGHRRGHRVHDRRARGPHRLRANRERASAR